MKKTLSRLSLISLWISVLALAACSNIDSSRNVNNPNVPGRILAAQVCSTCHGLTGESVSPMFPKLAGQKKEYLVAQLADFKGHMRSDSRGTQYMWGFTHLTPVQIEELAEYFAGQEPMRGRTGNSGSLVRGETIFHSGLPDLGVVQCLPIRLIANHAVG